MKPYKSNTEKEMCSPISSNCVIWQGPDLPCINLCKGDTVSDVVYKVADEVCTLKDSIGLSDVDLTCLLQVCSTTPEPVKTLTNILDLLVSKVCCLNDIVDNLPPAGNNYTEPILNLPACLQYSDGMGGTVTQLIHHDYTLRIATFLCALYTTVNTHTGQIASLQQAVYDLEHPTVIVPEISSCLLGGLETVEVVLTELESQFCDYKVALGEPSDINTAISKQCTGLTGATPALSTGTPMAVVFPGWKNTVQDLADSLTNLWFTVCDIRAAVKIIQTNCCQVDCNSIVIDFTYKWIDENTLRLFFFPRTSVPLGFWDCNQLTGTMFTATDGIGNESPVFITFRKEDPLDLTGLLDDITIVPFQSFDITDIGSSTPLDVTTGLTITGDVCFTNGDINCVKCVNKIIGAYVNTNCCTITASSEVTITYKVCFTETATTTTTTLLGLARPVVTIPIVETTTIPVETTTTILEEVTTTTTII